MEKILKNIIIISSCFLFTTCASKDVWQSKSSLTPKSYKSYSKSSKCSIGLLRRLLILPVRFQTFVGDKPYNEYKPILDKPKLWYSSDEQASQHFLKEAVDYLSNWKGYEVINLTNNQVDTKHTAITYQDIDNYTADLNDWTENPENYDNPSENIVRIISNLSTISNVDGVIVISGVNKFNSDAKATAVVLSASLLWPILLYDVGMSFNAHIFEVNTGKVVWKSSGASSIPLLFKKLENAIPKTMTR